MEKFDDVCVFFLLVSWIFHLKIIRPSFLCLLQNLTKMEKYQIHMADPGDQLSTEPVLCPTHQ